MIRETRHYNVEEAKKPGHVRISCKFKGLSRRKTIPRKQYDLISDLPDAKFDGAVLLYFGIGLFQA